MSDDSMRDHVSNVGHGHVYKRQDKILTRCGGPMICGECAKDFVRWTAEQMKKTNRDIVYQGDGYRDVPHMDQPSQAFVINTLAQVVHEANAKWWTDISTGQPIKRNVGEMLMLVTSELAEALEGDRKNLMDDKLPHRKMFEVEMADALIRILDIAGGMNLDLGRAFTEKMAYNAQRHDHTVEGRAAEGGKRY